MKVTGSLASLGLADQADVGLVDRGVDIDLLLQVRGDDEHHRRLELGGHGLARIDLAVDHDAVDRRADVGEIEVRLGRGQVGLALLDGGLAELDLGLQRFPVGDALVEIGLGDGLGGCRLSARRSVRIGLFQEGLDADQVGLGCGPATPLAWATADL